MAGNTENRRINIYINGQAATKTLSDIKQTMQKLIVEQSKMTVGSKEYTEATMKIKSLSSVLDRHQKQIKGTSSIWEGVTAKVAIFTTAINGVVGIFSSLKSKFSGAIDASSKFEENLDNLSSLTGLEGDELKYLADQAKNMSTSITEDGVRIKQTSTDILDAFTKMGSARPDLLANKEALKAVTEDAILLSEAAKMDLYPATEALANVMNQFQTESSESRRIINEMAAGSQAGAGDISYLSEAIGKCGTTAHLMGLSTTDAVAAIEMVAPNFGEASVAGNSFDKVLLKMKATQIGYKSGVFNMNDALEELASRLAAGEDMSKIFGVEHVKMVNILIQNRSEFNRYLTAVTETNKAEEMAAKNTDNAAARRAQAANKVQNALIELGDAVTPIFEKMGEVSVSFAKAMATLPGIYKEHSGLINSLGTALVAYIAISKSSMMIEKARNAVDVISINTKKTWNTLTGANMVAEVKYTAAIKAQAEALKNELTESEKLELSRSSLEEGSLAYNEKTISLLNNRADVIEKNISAEEKKIITETRKIESSKNNISALQEENKILEKQIEQYRLSGDVKAVEIAQSKIATNQKKIEKNTSQMVSSQTAIETATTKANTLAKQKEVVQTKISTAATAAESVAKKTNVTITQRLKLATTSLWQSMKANPLGWILGLIGAIVSAYQLFAKKTDELSEKMKEVNKSTKEDLDNLDLVATRCRVAAGGTNERRKAVEDLNKILREHHIEAIKETDDLDIIKKKTDAATSAIYEQSRARIYAARIEEINKKQSDSIEEAKERSRSNDGGMTFGESDVQSGGSSTGNVRVMKTDAAGVKKRMMNMPEEIRQNYELEIERMTNELKGDDLYTAVDARMWNVFKETGGKNLNEKRARDLYDKYYSKVFVSLAKEIEAAKAERDIELYNLEGNTTKINKIFSVDDSEKNALIERIKLMNEIKDLEVYLKNEDSDISEAANKRIIYLKAIKEAEEQSKEASNAAKEETDARLKFEKELNAFLDKNRSKTGVSQLDEINEIEQKYIEKIALCKKYGIDTLQLESMMYEEENALIQKWKEEELKSTEEKEKAKKEALLAAREEVDNALLSEEDRQLKAIYNKYAELISAARSLGDSNAEGILIAKQDAEVNAVQNPKKEKETSKLEMFRENIMIAENLYSSFSDFQSAIEENQLAKFQKRMNKRKSILAKGLNSGRISQEQYNARVSLMEEALEKKQAEMARKKAIREKALGIFNATINTASAVAKSLPNIALAAISAAMGALQIATIAAQPLPQYAKGGFTNGARVYVAGEKGKEWIAPNNMLNDPVTGPIIANLEKIRSGKNVNTDVNIPDLSRNIIPAYATGGYTNNTSVMYPDADSKSLNEIRSLVKTMEKYTLLMSDPNNRRAYISYDVQKKADKVTSRLDRARRI